MRIGRLLLKGVHDGICLDEILFDDTNDGVGLAPGSKYCYRILAEFPLPEGGTSYVSQEVCTLIEANAPWSRWSHC